MATQKHDDESVPGRGNPALLPARSSAPLREYEDLRGCPALTTRRPSGSRERMRSMSLIETIRSRLGRSKVKSQAPAKPAEQKPPDEAPSSPGMDAGEAVPETNSPQPPGGGSAVPRQP